MKQSERAQAILETAISDFIKSGRPITSEYLYETYDFGIKPATIRLELNALADDGYFYQNHPSGGRFPTNKAYRFFVERTREQLPENLTENAISLAREFLLEEKSSFLEDIASQFNVVSMVWGALGDAQSSNLSDLLGHVEADRKDDLVGIVEDCEMLPKRLRGLAEAFQGDALPQVFVGKSSVAKSDCISVLTGNFSTDGGEFTLAIIGPKRMDYRKSMALFKSIKKVSSIK
ncbi:MAG: hypothetical protein Q7R98_00480 [Candidatus Jorgensenbacteria bacterium]|nr:hypothetical protein [Candidatus Jorgensenbacteria bacterium]